MRISITSLRGGSGATSLAAMLGDALSSMGESVVLVDLNEADILRLHFGVPYTDSNGWAAAKARGLMWHERVFRVKEELTILPYGRNGFDLPLPDCGATDHDIFWVSATETLRNHYRWIIFDTPSGIKKYRKLREACDIDVIVAQPDMTSHVLLMQAELYPSSRILVNKLNPSMRLNNDIADHWRSLYSDRVVPLRVNSDENIHEAFAHKLPVTAAQPQSSGAQDAFSFATWCLANQREKS